MEWKGLGSALGFWWIYSRVAEQGRAKPCLWAMGAGSGLRYCGFFYFGKLNFKSFIIICRALYFKLYICIL